MVSTRRQYGLAKGKSGRPRFRRSGIVVSKPAPERASPNLTGLWEGQGEGKSWTLKINHVGHHVRCWMSPVNFPANPSDLRPNDFKCRYRRKVGRLVGSRDEDDRSVYGVEELDEDSGDTSGGAALVIESRNRMELLSGQSASITFERVHNQPTLSRHLVSAIKDVRIRDLVERNEWTPLTREQYRHLRDGVKDFLQAIGRSRRSDRSKLERAQWLSKLQEVLEVFDDRDRVLAIHWLTHFAWAEDGFGDAVVELLPLWYQRDRRRAQTMAKAFGVAAELDATFKYDLRIIDGRLDGSTNVLPKDVRDLCSKKLDKFDDIDTKMKDLKRDLKLKVGVGWHGRFGIMLLTKYEVDGGRTKKLWQEPYYFLMGGVSAGLSASSGAGDLLGGLTGGKSNASAKVASVGNGSSVSAGFSDTTLESDETFINLDPEDVPGGIVMLSSSMGVSFLGGAKASAGFLSLYGGDDALPLNFTFSSVGFKWGSIGADATILQWMTGYIGSDFPEATELKPKGQKPQPVDASIKKAAQAKVFFPFDEAPLTDLGRAHLRAVVAEQLAAFLSKGTTVMIFGHADHPGTRRYNMALSRARAINVRTAIMADYLEPSWKRTTNRRFLRVVTRGFGEKFAKGDEFTKDRKSRRVVMRVRGALVARLDMEEQ